jgi:hypothetical protein
LRSGPARVDAYRHTQFARRLVLTSVVYLVLASAVVAWLSEATRSAAAWLVVFLYAVLVAGIALFYRLTVVVDNLSVRAVFGIGLLRRVVPLAQIAGTEVHRLMRGGTGIRLTPAGWLYNAGGRDAVRLLLKRERPLIIGTDEPEALKAAIDAARARIAEGT